MIVSIRSQVHELLCPNAVFCCTARQIAAASWQYGRYHWAEKVSSRKMTEEIISHLSVIETNERCLYSSVGVGDQHVGFPQFEKNYRTKERIPTIRK